MISGAILTANDASEALKAINLRAIKILVLRTHSSGDFLVLIRKGGRAGFRLGAAKLICMLQ